MCWTAFCHVARRETAEMSDSPRNAAPGALVSGLQAALLLARGRPEGVQHLDNDMRAAARSFWAAAVALPAFLCLRLMDWSAEGLPTHPGHTAALDLLSFVIGWAGFAVISRRMVAAMGRGTAWPRFVAAWNWCNVVQYLLLVVAGIPLLLGAPDWVDQTAGLVALGWALWLEWFAARVTLQVPGFAAAGLVLADIVLGLILSGATEAALGS
jgi:hypothetical protein